MSSIATSLTLIAISPAQVNRFTAPTDLAGGRNSGCATSIVRKSSASTPTNIGNYVVHPEGSLIYWDGKIVSCQLITSTHRSIGVHILSHCGNSVSQGDITVFIEIKGHSQAEYYIVDHESKSILWIDNQCPESFRDASCAKHDHEYWIHIENFPGPFFPSPKDRHNLMNVLASSAVDASTSDGSTCPMSVEQIDKSLQMLKSFSDDVDINQTYAMARLWGMLLQSRVINGYGTPQARLDRFISISDIPPRLMGVYETLNGFMFRTPRAHLDRCSRAWADRIAYTQEWRKFRLTNEKEWQQVAMLASVLIIASLLVKIQSTCITVLLPNAALFTGLGSLAGAYYLLNESQNLGDHAADASVYFQQREEHLYGVQKIAVINAAPQALLIWGFIFFIAAILL